MRREARRGGARADALGCSRSRSTSGRTAVRSPKTGEVLKLTIVGADDERTPNRSEGYEDSATSSRTEDWDGHGPMPAPKGDPSSRVPGSSGGGKKKKKRNFLAPWEAEVSEDEVEGGAATVRSARPPVSSDYGPGPAGVGEEYYAPASQPSRYEGSSGLDRENSRLRTLVTGTTSARHRGDAGMSAPERGPSDRHARMNGARKRVEDPSSDRRNGVGYYDDGDVDPWSRSSENAAPKPAAKPADRAFARFPFCRR